MTMLIVPLGLEELDDVILTCAYNAQKAVSCPIHSDRGDLL